MEPTPFGLAKQYCVMRITVFLALIDDERKIVWTLMRPDNQNLLANERF